MPLFIQRERPTVNFLFAEHPVFTRLNATGIIYCKWIMRLPQEDFCQALNIPLARKYESHGGPDIEQIMSSLLGSTNSEQDRVNFMKSQVLFWLLAATDGHAKNFSLFIEAAGGYRLTVVE